MRGRRAGQLLRQLAESVGIRSVATDMPVWCANTSDGSAGILVADPDVTV